MSPKCTLTLCLTAFFRAPPLGERPVFAWGCLEGWHPCPAPLGSHQPACSGSAGYDVPNPDVLLWLDARLLQLYPLHLLL